MSLLNFTGDLFKYFERGDNGIKTNAIAHVCNCQGVMGSGIAREIKTRYPTAFEAYKQNEIDMQKIPAYQGLQLGTISYAEVRPTEFVFNLHAQQFYGTDKRHLNYEALYKSLEQMRSVMILNKIQSVGFPYMMGSDRAGGDWNVVRAMIESVFPSSYNICTIAVRLP